MTDHDRAERAFRDAFRQAASETDFTPLDPDALRAAASKAPVTRTWRTRWLPVAAAAAVFVVAVPVGVRLLQGSGPNVTSAVPEALPAASAPAEPSPGSIAGWRPRPGFRFASMGDVVVEVPQDWGYARSVGPDWCVAGPERQPGDPAAPFVDVAPESRGMLSIACPGDVPAARQAMHLTWAHTDLGGGAPVQPPQGWQRVTRVVGSLELTVVTPDDQRALADQVLATARQVSVDHLGCPTVAPVTPQHPHAVPAREVPAGQADEGPVVLCQYGDLSRSAANLVGSRELPAVPPEWLAARRSPGPTPQVPDCLPVVSSDVLVVMRWPGAGLDEWLRVPSCGVSAIVTASGSVPATADVCRAVFQPPLAFPDGFSGTDPCAGAQIEASPDPVPSAKR